MWVSVNMAFKLTYLDGQESDYDDDTVWEVDDGVLKLGKEEGKWSVLLSPSHWAVIELGGKSKGRTKSGDGDEYCDGDGHCDSDAYNHPDSNSDCDSNTNGDPGISGQRFNALAGGNW